MSKKQPNRLAQLIDHQAFAGSALPQTLADNMRLYIEATTEIKELLIDCLPEEILSTCWVVGLTSEQLTLSVGSMTAANHIRYLQNAYLQILTEQSITFKQLKQIRVVVAKISAHSLSSKKPLALSATLSKSHKANENQVTTDEKLKKALLRLANH